LSGYFILFHPGAPGIDYLHYDVTLDEYGMQPILAGKSISWLCTVERAEKMHGTG
jgi:hypothetical protein